MSSLTSRFIRWNFHSLSNQCRRTSTGTELFPQAFRPFWICLRISIDENPGKHCTRTPLVLHQLQTILHTLCLVGMHRCRLSTFHSLLNDQCIYPRTKTESEKTCFFCFRPSVALIQKEKSCIIVDKFRFPNEFSTISLKVISNNILTSKFVFLHTIKIC